MKYERNIADEYDNYNKRNTMTGFEIEVLRMAVSAIWDMVNSNNNSLDAEEAKSIMKKHVGDNKTAKDILDKVVSEVGKRL